MSTLRFSQAALSGALATVARIRPWQHDIKKSALIRAIVADGTCILTSSNLDMQVEVACAADGAAGEFALPLDAFAAFVGKTPAGARIDLTCSLGSTLVTSGRSRCTLQASLHDAAPLRQAAEGSQFSMPAATLAACLEAAVPATGDDKAQPHLGGVNIRDGAGGITFAAQDGNRLHIAAQDGNRCDASVVIPWRAVDAILSVLPREGHASITVDSYRVTIASGAVSVTSSLLGGSYPPVDARAAPLTDRELRARADDLLSAIALVMTVANERDRDFRFDLGVDCRVSAFRQNGDAGAVGFDASYQGAPLAIGFQFDPVRDALILFGAHAIRWRMGGPEDPTIITCDARPGVQAVLSPYRLIAEHLRSAA